MFTNNSNNSKNNDNNSTGNSLPFFLGEAENLESCFDILPVGVIITNLQGDLIYVNQAAVDILHYDSKNDLLKTKASAHYKDPNDRHKILNDLKIRNIENLVVQFRGKNGQLFWGSMNSSYISGTSGNNIITVLKDITELKEAQVKLVNSEMQFRSIFENANEAILIIKAGIISFVNPQFLKFFRVKNTSQVIGKPLLKFVAQKDKERVSAISANRIKGSYAPEIFEIEAVRSDESTFNCEISVSTYKESNEQINVFFLRDVTEEKEKLEKLKLSEQRFRLSEEIAHIVYYERNLTTNEIFVSDEFFKMTGYKPPKEKITIEFIYSVYHKDDLQMVQKKIQAATESDEEITFIARIIKNSGEINYIRVLAKKIPDINGRDIKLVASILNITDILKKEENLRLSEKRLRNAEKMAMIGHWERDIRTNKTIMSEGHCRIFGHEPGLYEDPHKIHHEQFHKDDIDRVNKIISESLKKGNGYSYAARILRPDGEIRHIETIAEIERDKNGNPIRVIGVTKDLTESKNMEEKLRNQQRLEALGILAGSVAHEINNPINGIMNYSQLIHDCVDDDDVRGYSAEIISESDRIAIIVRDLLRFARKEKKEHEYVYAEEIISQTLTLVKTIIVKDQIELNVNFQKNLSPIKCNSQQVQQVLINLITNARDILNEKYPGYDEDKKINVFCEEIVIDNKDTIRITVEDHGNGIKPEVQEKIFDPFFTTKEVDKGTGLGLSISYGIIKEHGGDLSFETKAGKYTKFYIDLPID